MLIFERNKYLFINLDQQVAIYKLYKISRTKNKSMQEFKNATMKTELQQFILDLAKHKAHTSKVDLTFFGLLPDDYDDGIFESLTQYNQFFLEKFYQAVYGKENQEFNPEVYQQVTLSDVTLFTKQFQHENKSIRMVFIPAEKYVLSNDDKGPQAYIKMVKKFYLSNLFMKQSATDDIKIIAMDFVPKPAEGLKGKLKGINITEHVKKLFEELKKNFNIGSQTQLSKLAFLFPISEKRDRLLFTSGDSKDTNVNGQILFLTNDDKMHPVYRLLKQGQVSKLSNQQEILRETKSVVTTKNFHHLFHYNAFVNYKPKLAKNNILDQITASELWGVIETIIYPLLRVKQMISDDYKLPEEEGKTKKIFQTIEKQKWSNVKAMKNDFALFNELFEETKWIESQRGVVVINDEEDQMEEDRYGKNMHMYNSYSISKKQHLTPTPQQTQSQKLSQYSRHFKLYSRFLNQQPHFIHAMILDHINSLHEDISETSDEIHKATEINKQRESQNKLLSWTKAIVRFLAQLKKHSMFFNSLQSYNPEFYQYLLEIYLQAYAEFCSANKQLYGKMFDLSQKVGSLKSTKKQILKVLKNVDSFTQIYKNHKFTGTQKELDDKRLLLEIMFRLLKENKSEEKDKEIDTKIMSTQYDLGSTYYKIALIRQYGHTQSTELKKALKILYNDLYLKLFIDRKDFEKEFSKSVDFNELELLEKVSGLLKLLDHIDLAIEIEKKLDNITTVQNYFNRWLMKYHRLHGEEDHKRIVEICQKAIQYFTIKFQVNKVTHFYDLLMKNSLTFAEKSEWKDKRFRYLNSSRDGDWCKKGMEKAEKTLFPITTDISEKIKAVYAQLLDNKSKTLKN